MRYLILISASLTLFTCSRESKDVSVTSDTSLETNLNTAESNKLLGEWGIYTWDDIYCNTCPKIIFNSDKTAILTYPNELLDHLKWEIKNNALEIIGTNRNNESLFVDSVYLISLVKTNIGIELKLTHPETQHYILLRRNDD